MDNMKIYNASATVPKEALKDISAGRLKGMSDINPMWRIKRLTEEFGPCGFGWWYEITEQRLEKGIDEISAFVSINLFVKVGEQISMPIPGVGGSSFLTKESSGRMYQSDECFKMALTDAIGISCKALGFASTVYYAKDRTKYDQAADDVPTPKVEKATGSPKSAYDKPVTPQHITPDQCIEVNDIFSEHGWDLKKAMKERWKIGTLGEMTLEMYNGVLKAIAK
jgi:hypothetical protein